MKNVLMIQNYMSPTPYSIEADQSVAKAHDLMKAHSIRHLPVLSQGQIKGMVSDRDVQTAISLVGVDASNTKVAEIAYCDLFLVRPDARLDDVVRKMAALRIGCVLVIDQHKLVGIFTTTDALQALHDVLQSPVTPAVEA